MKRYATELIRKLEDLGYEFDRRNAAGFRVYVRDDMPDLAVNPGISENAARQLLRQATRALGVAEDAAKRNPAQIRERQAADRIKAAAEVARLDRERDELIAQRSRLLSGRVNGLTRKQVRAIERLVEEKERERRHWESLMTSTPASAEHRGTGQARHRNGERSA